MVLISFLSSYHQINTSIRYGPLLKSLNSLTVKLHNPPNWSHSELIVTNGSQDGLSRTFEMLIEKNDYVLLQEPCYTGTLAIVCYHY